VPLSVGGRSWAPYNTMLPGPRPTSVPYHMQVASWSIQPFGHNRHRPRLVCVRTVHRETVGTTVPGGRGAGSHLTQCRMGGLRPTSVPRKGRKERKSIYSGFSHQGTYKALRRGSHSFTCKQHHAWHHDPSNCSATMHQPRPYNCRVHGPYTAVYKAVYGKCTRPLCGRVRPFTRPKSVYTAV